MTTRPIDSRQAALGLFHRGRSSAAFRLLAGVVFVLLLAISAGLLDSDPEAAFHVAIAYSTLAMLYILAGSVRRTGDVLNPLALAMIYLGLLFPFHAALVSDDSFIVDLLGAARTEYYTYSLWIAGSAAFLMAWGFGSGAAKRIRRRLPRLNLVIDDRHPSLVPKLAVLYGLAVVARALMVMDGLAFHFETAESGKLIRFQFLLLTVSRLAPLTMLMLIGSGIQLRLRTRIQVGLLLLVLEVAWGFATGSRLAMLLPLVTVVFLLNRVWKRLRIHHLILGLALFSFVAFPLVTAFRTAYFHQMDTVQREGVTSAVLTTSAVTAFGDSDVSPFGDPRRDALETLAMRTHGALSLSLIIRYTPERHPYLYGVPFAMIPLNILVPRAIWPDKPNVGQFVDDFRVLYWGLERGDSTSVAISQLGDLWVNLSLAGVILGSLLMGVGLRYLHSELRIARGPTVFPVVIYAIMIVPIVRGLSAPVDGFVAGNAKILLFLVAVAWFLSVRTKDPDTA